MRPLIKLLQPDAPIAPIGDSGDDSPVRVASHLIVAKSRGQGGKSEERNAK